MISMIPILSGTLGMISPAYWAMDAFHQVSFFGKGFATILPNLLILLAFTAVFMVLALRFFKIKD